MTLNHVHLGAADVALTAGFYMHWFGFEKEADHGAGVFLRDGAGFLIAIDPAPEPHSFPGWFHLGFCQDAERDAHDLHERMQAAGVMIGRKMLSEEGEYASYYCRDPDGTNIEVSWFAE